jgi:hypothetical protein
MYLHHISGLITQNSSFENAGTDNKTQEFEDILYNEICKTPVKVRDSVSHQ